MNSSKSVKGLVTKHGIGSGDVRGTLTICMASELKILANEWYEDVVVRESTEFGSDHTPRHLYLRS